MYIDFDGMQTKKLPNFKGGEKTFRADMFDDWAIPKLCVADLKAVRQSDFILWRVTARLFIFLAATAR